MIFSALFSMLALVLSPEAVKTEFGERDGALIILNGAGETVLQHHAAACAEKLPPCSTFKIWNTAIGLETGVVTDPDAPFWKWDGEEYPLKTWNQDQTLRSAFTVSCVPAYRDLARKIGAEKMAKYLHEIGYGNEDISSGLDLFWLPAEGRKPLLISPAQQAGCLAKLVGGKLSFSPRTLAVLKDVMKATPGERGVLYGKTGTSEAIGGAAAIGWYVGYVESGGKVYPFACTLRGSGVMGRDARALVEKVFSGAGLL